MSAPYVTNHMLERAIELRESCGLSLARIAVEVGCAEKTLSYHFIKLGVEPPKPRPLRPEHHLRCPTMMRRGHVVRAFTPEEDALLLLLELAGLTHSQIGRSLKRAPNSVGGRLMTLARREERAADAS